MNNIHLNLGQRVVRTGAAIGAAILLGTGAAWHLHASAEPAAAPAPAAASPQLSRAAALDGRTSYSDIVKVVSPAVVTIHVEGKASASETQFQVPDDDFFRRFFGNPGDRQGPAPGRRAPGSAAWGPG